MISTGQNWADGPRSALLCAMFMSKRDVLINKYIVSSDELGAPSSHLHQSKFRSAMVSAPGSGLCSSPFGNAAQAEEQRYITGLCLLAIQC